jgi:hypothetical protein
MPAHKGETMKRELVKGTTMLLLIVSLAFVTAVAANAQSRRANADVPFDFVAGNRTLPAGHYNIADSTTGREVVRISELKQAKGVFALTILVSSREAPKQSKLVFHRYGNRYFLAEIWNAGDREGQKLMKSREEKSIENELAIISSKTELPQRSYERVEIALGRN